MQYLITTDSGITRAARDAVMSKFEGQRQYYVAIFRNGRIRLQKARANFAAETQWSIFVRHRQGEDSFIYICTRTAQE